MFDSTTLVDGRQTQNDSTCSACGDTVAYHFRTDPYKTVRDNAESFHIGCVATNEDGKNCGCRVSFFDVKVLP
ncbi:MAG: hypothetical protein ACR2KS_10320 [Candidatus Eremiobacter antarcticus]|nr:hypothetical protein [Candidatus Eremiobacteraeota bacterium]